VPGTALDELLRPGACVLVTQECQVGVVGEGAVLRDLADAAAPVALPNIVRLVAAARAAGVAVVHCLAHRRTDALGANANARLFAATTRLGIDLRPGAGGDLLPALGPEPSDLVLTRLHGIGPMGGTDLDPVLRNLGVSTIVGVGVSVNVGITNFVMDAVNAGYRFVLPRDAVAGVPAGYADAVIDNTLALLATVTTTDEVVARWAGGRTGPSS
jgi:nicotinamidase-related amidase